MNCKRMMREAKCRVPVREEGMAPSISTGAHPGEFYEQKDSNDLKGTVISTSIAT
ncbi:hypothetical protein GCM10010038_20140 [Glutamicibacter protophormiae]|nr:hypothetical protein GCM10010038_20140 [Glutamicibacter protophormiae]